MKLYTTITVFYMLLIIFLSHLPQEEVSVIIVSGPDNIDLFLHFIEYLILGFLLFQSITKDGFPINPIYGSILIGISFAISDEFHQSFVPGRHMSSMDMLFDSVGILFGTMISSQRFNSS